MHARAHAVILLVLAVVPLWSADWYVAPGGNDAASGSQAEPLATISQALTRSGGGDRILLQRGGTWRGSFSIGGGRQLLAYGSGANPVVTTSTVVTMSGTWPTNPTVRTGGVTSEALALWVNGTFQPMARYPNSGYLQTATGTSLNAIAIASPASRASGRWTGAQVRWHRWHWFWEARTITSDGGSSGSLGLSDRALTATGASVDPQEEGLVGVPSGFFVCKDLDELDAPGEWFSDASAVYVYPPAGVDAGSMVVEVASDDAHITVDGATVRGIDFRRFAVNAVEVNNASTIEDCTFAEIGDSAISTSWNSAPLVVRGCVFRDVRNCGVTVLQDPASSGTRIERNLFQRIGVERGYGGSGTWHHVGVLANMGDIEITLNRMVDIGYAGILLGNTPGNIARRNVIVRSMSTSNDGAGIYTFKGPNTMSENIVLDARGDQTAAEPFFPFGNGIWPEFLDRISDSAIEDNTIAGCNGSGIALINNVSCDINRNVLFDNLNAGLLLDVTDNTGAQGHTIDDNVFVNLATTNRLPVEGTIASWYLDNLKPAAGVLYANTITINDVTYPADMDYGLMRRSSFVAPSGTHLARASNGTVFASIADLVSAESDWVQNTGNQSTQNAVLLINDTEVTTAMTVPAGSWTRTDGTAVAGTVTIDAFRSVVLVSNGTALTTPVYRTASGIDWRLSEPTQQPLLAVAAMAVARGGAPVSDAGIDAVTGSVAGVGSVLSYGISNLGSSSLAITTPVSLTPSGCTISAITQPAASVGSTPTTLAFTVTPAAAGAWSVQVVIVSNDPDGDYTWTISGSATAAPEPEIGVARGATSITDGGSDTLGGTAAGTGSQLAYTISNSGSAVVTLTSPVTATPVGNCTVTVSSQPAASIAAGGSGNLVLSVTPNAAGAWSFDVAVASTDGDENPYTWTVSGTASAPGTASTGTVGGGGGGACGAGLSGVMLLAWAGLFLRRRR